MRAETITRLRNAFAQAALDWLGAPKSSVGRPASGLPFSSMTEGDWRQAVTYWRQYAAEMLEGVATRSCPACGCGHSRSLFVSYDDHPFHECDSCGCWFEPKVVDAALFERFFERCPEAGALARRMMDARDRDAGRDADMARVGGYLDDLLPLLPPATGAPRAYLDAGCGVGHSLRAGRLRGLTVQGVEADGTAVALARQAGLPVVDLSEAVPGGPYHLLSFWETLEHVAAPLEALERYLPLLDADGLVAITVPNLNALATQTLRESCAWVHGGYNTPGHVNLFSVTSLERLLTRAGLSLLDADGQFSGNPVELAASLVGETRGAFDSLHPTEARGSLSQSLCEIIDGVWPGVALVERLALTSPILQVIACKQGREARFASAIQKRQARRAQQVVDQSRSLLASEPDYKAMAVGLQDQVDRRDVKMVEIQDTANHLQRQLAEAQDQINLRDELLQRQLAEAQDQINLRDELLVASQRTLDRTVDERVRSVLRAVRRRMDR